MSGIFDKIGLGLRTYRHAFGAMRLQYRPGDIRRVQERKLQALVRHCYENTKYYREVFDDAGIRPGGIRTTEDLANVPVLTRDTLRERFWDFLPHELPACRVSRTSGSTGSPVCILSDRNSRMHNSAAVIRYRRAVGMRLAGGAVVTPLKTAEEGAKRPQWTYMQGIHKTYYVNPYLDSAEHTAYGAEVLEGLKGAALIGITPAIKALAYKVRDGVLPSFKPIAVLPMGEILTPELRELFESTFGARVYDIYACNEAGDVAWQCGRGDGYHINADNCIVEILKEGKPCERGEVGQIAITNLNRYSMPIMRYENGDLGRLAAERCECGCELPMLAEIIGRTGQDIILPDGVTVAWNRLKSEATCPQIRQFQIVQNDNGDLTVRYVPENGADIGPLEALLAKRYAKLLGDSVKVSIERTARIAPEASGKMKLVISNYRASSNR
jgi:phenylacetate-CoA ligase